MCFAVDDVEFDADVIVEVSEVMCVGGLALERLVCFISLITACICLTWLTRFGTID